jgi:hypothetical protein
MKIGRMSFAKIDAKIFTQRTGSANENTGSTSMGTSAALASTSVSA